MYWDRFDIVEAHYLFCEHYHSGQWSPEYARLCRISRYYKPSPMGVTLSENAQDIYDNLVSDHNAHNNRLVRFSRGL